MTRTLVFGVLALAIGGVTLWFAYRVSSETRTKAAWPTVPGKIVERGVGEPMGKGRNYIPHAVYRYEVGGKAYTHDQVYMIRRTGLLHDKAQELVDGLPDPVPVHYNPENPQDAFLLLNPKGTSWLMIGVGALFALIGLMQLVIALAKRG